jgi:hypothetical protein
MNTTPRIFFMAASLLLAASFVACAQKSPQAKAENTVDGVKITIDYHSPRVRDRVIWGGLEAYDKVWRTGADNATTFEVSGDVTIDGKRVPEGKYSLFTIPKKGEKWTVILNKVWDQWGAYNYDEGEDLVRFDVETKRTIDLHENMSFEVSDSGKVTFMWEYMSFSFDVDPA